MPRQAFNFPLNFDPMKKFLAAILLLPLLGYAQPYKQPDGAQIKLKLKKLNVLASVLYVAAHPDDENTRVITYLGNDRLATVGYLAMTRGDGGQNLIGPEIRDRLGLIRTQELLAARRIDGGQQFFTRANDFGYSKSPEETFSIWGREEILSDVVKIFRQYQPDVIITRFPPEGGGGHGHHTASAILAGVAFDLAGDKDAYPDQVKTLGTWNATRLFVNTGRWWNSSINDETPGVVVLDVGGYNTLLGKSYPEISALSSSQHKSQGWGRRGTRGSELEYFQLTKGSSAEEDIFEGINIGWSRIKNSGKVQELVNRAAREFNSENPAAIVPVLLQLRKEIGSLGDSVWKARKLRETDELIQDCLGLFAEVTASHFQGSPGEAVNTTIEVINRSATDISLESIHAPMISWDTTYASALSPNDDVRIATKSRVVTDAKYSDPYWLKEPHGTGRFTVNDAAMIGLPENPPAVQFEFVFSVGGEKVSVKRPLIYKWVDPVKGELWRPFEIVPPVFLNLSEGVVVFNSKEPRSITVTARSSVDRPLHGILSLRLPSGWKCVPKEANIELLHRDVPLTTTFTIYPGQEGVATITASFQADGKDYSKSLELISYDHFPAQTLLPPATAKAVRVDLKKAGTLVGYIRGAGDDIPSALRNMGYEVWELIDSEVTPENLAKLDALVFGIRAFNTNGSIPGYMANVLEYAHGGGTVVVQYNTVIDLMANKLSPYPLKISHDRVTEENAEVRILKPDHSVLNYPNKITARDFEGWVQERGLYFPNEWDPTFEAILSMNDTGEKPMNSSLLVARYGNGYYVYTGLSFFRELPEGVPGAYKLFANLVSLGSVGKAENKPK